jgi:hypothetical protein
MQPELEETAKEAVRDAIDQLTADEDYEMLEEIEQILSAVFEKGPIR